MSFKNVAEKLHESSPVKNIIFILLYKKLPSDMILGSASPN